MRVFVRKEFAMAHRLLGHKKCETLHGHTWVVEVGVEGKEDEKGMVLDFSILDSIVDEVIGRFDHKVCLSEDDPLVYDLPSGACILVPNPPTTETLARIIGKEVKDILRREEKDFPLVVRVYESPRHWAEVSL